MTIKKHLVSELQDWAERLQAELRGYAAENIGEWVDSFGSAGAFSTALLSIRDEEWPGTTVAVLCDAFLGALEDEGYDLEETGEWTEEDEAGLLEELRELARLSASRKDQ